MLGEQEQLEGIGVAEEELNSFLIRHPVRSSLF